MRPLAAVWSLLCLTVPLGAAEIATGAVVDPERGIVYLMAPGALEARDVKSGALRWSSTEAARPLVVRGGRLLAQVDDPAETLRLVLLDAGSGARLSEHARSLPAGARAWIDEQLEQRFELRVEGDGPLARLTWAFEKRLARGVHDEGEDGADARPWRATGALQVDLENARFVPDDMPAVVPGSAGAVSLPSALAAEADTGSFRERPFPVGPWFVASQRVPAGGLVLRRFARDGAPVAPVPLPDGARPHLGSADGRHLLVSAQVSRFPERAHAWTVIALDSGAVVATFGTSTAAAPFALAAGRALIVQQPWARRQAGEWHDEPRRLEAIDTATGSLAWTAVLRDPAYRGPQAP